MDLTSAMHFLMVDVTGNTRVELDKLILTDDLEIFGRIVELATFLAAMQGNEQTVFEFSMQPVATYGRVGNVILLYDFFDASRVIDEISEENILCNLAEIDEFIVNTVGEVSPEVTEYLLTRRFIRKST